MIDNKGNKVILVNDTKISTDEELQKLKDISYKYSNAIFFTERTYEDDHTDLNIYAGGNEYISVRGIDTNSSQVVMGTNKGMLELLRDEDTGRLYFNVDTSDVIIMRSDKYAAVLNACYENNLCASPDKMTKAEAEAVTNINDVFKGNTEITRFNTLKYFTGLTSIPDWAFSGCTALTSVAIPDSVTSIGYWAFNLCSSLCFIDISNSVTTINAHAFRDCGALSSITLPNTLESIKYSAFRNCASITSITLPPLITSLESDTFLGCTSLTTINLDNITTFENSVFNGCSSLKSVILKDDANLTDTINLFNACTNLDYIKLPSTLEIIPKGLLRSCNNLSSIVIPSNVTTIGIEAFKNCYNLENFVCLCEEAPEVQSDAFLNIGSSTDNNTLHVPVNATGYNAGAWLELQERSSHPYTLVYDVIMDSYSNPEVMEICHTQEWASNSDYMTISEAAAVTSLNTAFRNSNIAHFDELQYFTSVTSLVDNAFNSCTSLVSIALPTGVTDIGSKAFYNCYDLSKIICLTASAPSIISNTFNGAGNNANTRTLYVAADAPGYNDGPWHDLQTRTTAPWSLKEVIMTKESNPKVMAICTANNWCADTDYMTKSDAEAVTNIGTAFYASDIVHFDELQYFGISEIPNNAFNDCTQLTEITLPEGLTEFGSNSFKNCSLLSKINNLSSITKIGASCFEKCSLIDNDIIFKSELGSIPTKVFYNAPKIKSVIIEDGITNIESYILSYNEIITELSIPDNVKAVKASTYLMKTLEKLKLPANYNTLYNSMFRYCYALATIENYPEVWELPTDVTYITSCFENCYAFAYPVKIAEGLKTLGKYFFREARSISIVELPSSVTTIEAGAFANAYNISDLIINASEAPELKINEEATGITDIFYNMGKNAATRTLYVPAGATGYDEGGWLELQTRANYPYTLDEIIITSESNHEVMDICHSQGWCARADFMTKSEAEAVTDIGEAFEGSAILHFDELQYFTNIPAAMTTNFELCRSLVQITLPSHITSLAGTFRGCSVLTTITMPNTITTIGNYSFHYCGLLEMSALPSSLTSVGKEAFLYCEKFNPSGLPNGLLTIGASAFYRCGFTEIALPSGTTSIADSAFSYCSKCDSIVLPSSVATIGASSFAGCNWVTKFTSYATTAPTAQNNSFTNMGYYDAPNALRIPSGASGYDAGAWLELQERTNRKFVIEYI